MRRHGRPHRSATPLPKYAHTSRGVRRPLPSDRVRSGIPFRGGPKCLNQSQRMCCRRHPQPPQAPATLRPHGPCTPEGVCTRAVPRASVTSVGHIRSAVGLHRRTTGGGGCHRCSPVSAFRQAGASSQHCEPQRVPTTTNVGRVTRGQGVPEHQSVGGGGGGAEGVFPAYSITRGAGGGRRGGGGCVAPNCPKILTEPTHPEVRRTRRYNQTPTRNQRLLHHQPMLQEHTPWPQNCCVCVPYKTKGGHCGHPEGTSWCVRTPSA